MMTGLRIKTAILYRKIKFINEISDQVVNGWYVVDGKEKTAAETIDKMRKSNKTCALEQNCR